MYVQHCAKESKIQDKLIKNDIKTKIFVQIYNFLLNCIKNNINLIKNI